MRDSLPTTTATTERVSLGTLFWIFLKIGSVTFGGFMALISVIADTIVERRKLLKQGTRLRRDTVIPQWFQASKAAAASDGHAVHC
jgi:hypothetical protein